MVYRWPSLPTPVGFCEIPKHSHFTSLFHSVPYFWFISPQSFIVDSNPFHLFLGLSSFHEPPTLTYPLPASLPYSLPTLRVSGDHNISHINSSHTCSPTTSPQSLSCQHCFSVLPMHYQTRPEVLCKEGCSRLREGYGASRNGLTNPSSVVPGDIPMLDLPHFSSERDLRVHGDIPDREHVLQPTGLQIFIRENTAVLPKRTSWESVALFQEIRSWVKRQHRRR